MIQAVTLFEDLVLEAAGKRNHAWFLGVFRQILQALLIGGRHQRQEDTAEEDSEIQHFNIKWPWVVLV